MKSRLMPDLFYTNPESLSSLLQDIDEGKLVLPEFQRSFNWDPKREDALIRSIINSYPAGGLLFLEQPSQEETLGKRLVAGVDPSRENVHPTRIILDGQQRLTTLYHVLYGTGGLWTRRALIDIGKAEKFFDSNGNLPSAGTDTGQQLVKDSLIHTYGENVHRTYSSLEQFFAEQVIPLTCIFKKERVLSSDKAEQYVGTAEWKYRFAEYQESNDPTRRLTLMKKLDKIEERFIKPIEEYRFPVTLLTRNTEPHAVCQVFVDLNIQQKPLDPFEVVAAKVWPFRIDLYEKWNQSLLNNPDLEFFQIDRDLLLQAVSLIQTSHRAKKEPDTQIRCTKAALYELQPQDFESIWDDVVASINWCLGLLKGEAGALVPKWLPYSTLLVAMGATVVVSKKEGIPLTEMKQKILRWYWCSVFAGTYAGSTNTQNAWDFQQLTAWMKDGSAPYTVSAFSDLFNADVLKTVSSQRSGQYKGVICLLLKQHAKDFYTRQGINTSLILQEEIEDHHVFPFSYLEQRGIEPTTRDCVLNRALIDAHTNGSIGANPPSSYLDAIRQEKGEDWLTGILESQMLPTNSDSSLFHDDFMGFIEERKDLVSKAITQIMG
jgi:hypothetical protein